MRKTILTFLLAIVASIGTMTAEIIEHVQIGDLYYNFDTENMTAEVTYKLDHIIGQDGSVLQDIINEDRNITSVEIPDTVPYQSVNYGVTSIGMYAFRDCYELTSVTIPNTVTSIREKAFTNCYSINTLIVPNTVTYIAGDAFGGILNVVYSGTATWNETGWMNFGARCLNGYVDGLLVYSDDTKTALMGCSASAKGDVIIPNTVTSIGSFAFLGCENVTSVSIPESVETIGAAAFVKCTGLTEITIPLNVTSIGESAFENCSGITSIIWNAKNCNASINKVENEIVAWTFREQVESFVFGNEVESIPWGLCNGMVKLTSVIIPNSVTSIGHSAFASCSGLTNVTIGNHVETIGMGAFANCVSLKQVTIPSSVTSIEDHAFTCCFALSSITCEAITPPTCGEGVFFNINSDKSGNKPTPLYVPANSVDAYKKADVWKEFGENITPIQAVEVEVSAITAKARANSVVIEWPEVEEATIYDIDIKKEEESIYHLSFNAQGQLLNISFEKKSGNGASKTATQTATGWQYTIDGLDAGTEYTYKVVAKNGDTELFKDEKQFTTTIATAIDEFVNGKCQNGKLIRDGQIFILRDGVMYNAQGAKVE